jgi:hypothetical protein
MAPHYARILSSITPEEAPIRELRHERLGGRSGRRWKKAKALRHHCATMHHRNHDERREPQHTAVAAKVLVVG